MATKKPSRLAKAIIEMANDQYQGGLMDTTSLEKITLRHLGEKPEPPVAGS